MTKSELINSLMTRLKLSQDQSVISAVNTLLKHLGNSLHQGERIEIRGFGSFRLNEWGPRHARNPITGESWRTDPTVAVHFKPGKELRDRVNGDRIE